VADTGVSITARAHRLLELLHAPGYFVPEVQRALAETGLQPGRMLYFAARSAPMGRVEAAVVAATFYHFNPELVGQHIPLAWTLAEPAAISAARLAGVDAALRRLLGPEVLAGAELAEAATLARQAIEGQPVEGRPLYAGHAELAWPQPAHLRLWHAATLLREYRGDGHVAALAGRRLSGIDGLVSHTATGKGFLPEAARTRRGWSEQQWSDAVARLRTTGLLAPDELALTEAGWQLRTDVEAHTDELSAAPWQRLGTDGTARLIELLEPLVHTALANGALPDGIFATLPGRRAAAEGEE
jgi:hypothetical protein